MTAEAPRRRSSSALLSHLRTPHVLRDYALLADGERGILVGPHGDHAWMCFPGWADGSVFSSLIGGGGIYTVTPTGRHVWGGWYEEGSLIWRNRWVTDDGATVECREALAMPSRRDRAVILRRIHALDGPARLQVALQMSSDYGRRGTDELHRRGGEWDGRSGAVRFRWSGAAAARRQRSAEGSSLSFEVVLEEGGHHDLVLEIAIGAFDDHVPDPGVLWSSTEAAWRQAVPGLSTCIAEHDARQALAVLRGVTLHGGGMVAAATTSLPERARAGRNYDYRYAWIRDQSYAGLAAARVEAYPLLDDAVSFVRDRLLADGSGLRPAYTVRGGEVPRESDLDVPGYPGGTDRIGNHVRDQFQLDCFGEALLLFAAADEHQRLDAVGWSAAEVAVAAIAECWQRPEAGIWELDDHRWTHSRLSCAAGLRAMARRASAGHAAGASWLELADRLVAVCAAQCVHPSGRWQRAPDDDRPDASLLLAAIRGAVPADDPRSTATLHTVREELSDDLFTYRYRPDPRPLGLAEGAFLLCGFWMALALHQQGDQVAANRWFERNRAACGTPGLFSEEFDVTQHQLRGNLPQAFVHAILLETAATLGESSS